MFQNPYHLHSGYGRTGTLSLARNKVIPISLDVNGKQPKGIATAAEFKAFAAAVNAGESTAEWENAEGWVNLLNDIDFDGVNDFVPVGYVTAPWVSSVPTISEGNPFMGKFDGNAFHIKNLHLVCKETTAGKHYGLFGSLYWWHCRLANSRWNYCRVRKQGYR